MTVAHERFALIVDPGAASSLLGRDCKLWAACLVDGGTAACHVAETREEILALTSGFPRTPSGYGPETALPCYADEANALAMAADALAAATPRFPPGFVHGRQRFEGGLSARLTPYGLDIAVSLSLAETLGWRDGDWVSLAASETGTLLAVAAGGNGARLERSHSDPGSLVIDRDLSGVPLSVALEESEWMRPQYEAAAGVVVFPIPAPAAPSPRREPCELALGDSAVRCPPAAMAIRAPWCLLAFSAGLAAGFAGGLVWL